ncbi:hypothetical protein BBJ28_00011856 [Nothophytophthora sp. Chile5]|nr:hypothetical protein BBJ28_00011856 [Nothophytophthora sp. Chile5]
MAVNAFVKSKDDFPLGTTHGSPLVYLDLSLPATADNFRLLCTGTRRFRSLRLRLFAFSFARDDQDVVDTGEMRSKGKVKALWYKNTRFHRVVPGFMMQGGDLTHGIHDLPHLAAFAAEGSASGRPLRPIVVTDAGQRMLFVALSVDQLSSSSRDGGKFSRTHSDAKLSANHVLPAQTTTRRQKASSFDGIFNHAETARLALACFDGHSAFCAAMTSTFQFDDRQDADLLLGEFLFEEADAFALPLYQERVGLSDSLLLDFDHDDALLTPLELDAALQQSAGVRPCQSVGREASSDAPMSPLDTDDDSTDAASEVATPPPAYSSQVSNPFRAAETQSPPARVALLCSQSTTHSPLPKEQKQLATRSSGRPTCPVASAPTTSSATKTLQASTPFAGSLPFALPVAFFPPLNGNQKRPFPQVLPNVASPAAAADCSDATGDAGASKKSKREIRQMKNRESANKSRLRRKAQLSTLSTEVSELTQKQQELQTIIAGLRAENKSLLDQNTFLRSLVTNCKQEPSFAAPNGQVAGYVQLPPMEQSCIALSVLESGQKMEVDADGQVMDMDLSKPPPSSKRRSTASTLSTASLAVCASVFGITVFADYEGTGPDSSNIRGVGRVLHEAPSALGVEGCSTEGPSSLVEFVVAAVGSWWKFVSSSELVFGVLLNVLSFVVIMGLYQLWQSRSLASGPQTGTGVSKPRRRSARCQTHLVSNRAALSGEDKRRSGSWQDVRLRDKPRGTSGA